MMMQDDENGSIWKGKLEQRVWGDEKQLHLVMVMVDFRSSNCGRAG